MNVKFGTNARDGVIITPFFCFYIVVDLMDKMWYKGRCVTYKK